MNLKTIVVSYNQEVKKSPVIGAYLQSNLSYENLIVIDNSTQEDTYLKNKIYCDKKGFIHINMMGNKGLSCAYNAALKSTDYNQHDYWYAIFDQDTLVDKEYFSKVNLSIKKSPDIGIHLPIVYSNNGLFSPLLLKKNKEIMMDIVPKIYENLIGINSGIVIHSRVFREIGLYDEDLFLDLVDYNFFRKCIKFNAHFKFKVFDYSLHQNFSGESFENFDGDLKRFKIYKKDYIKYCKKNKINFSKKYLTLYKRAFNLAIKYRKYQFFKVLFLN